MQHNCVVVVNVDDDLAVDPVFMGDHSSVVVDVPLDDDDDDEAMSASDPSPAPVSNAVSNSSPPPPELLSSSASLPSTRCSRRRRTRTRPLQPLRRSARIANRLATERHSTGVEVLGSVLVSGRRRSARLLSSN